MMKFNWGTGIFIFYSIFVLTLVFIVYKSTQYDHSLVVEDYYAKDLAYQGQYDKIKNSKQLEEKLQVYYTSENDQVQVRFPDNLGSDITGEILLYRADSKAKDVLLPIKINDSNDMMLDVSEMTGGRWKVQVDWKANGKNYFDEKIIHLKTP